MALRKGGVALGKGGVWHLGRRGVALGKGGVWHLGRRGVALGKGGVWHLGRRGHLSSLLRLYVPAYLETNPMAFGLVLGTKFLVYITALCLYVPAGTLVHYQWMNLTLVAAMVIFYRTWKSDPGHIQKCTNPTEAHRVSPPTASCVYTISVWLSVCVCMCYRWGLTCC